MDAHCITQCIMESAGHCTKQGHSVWWLKRNSDILSLCWVWFRTTSNKEKEVWRRKWRSRETRRALSSLSVTHSLLKWRKEGKQAHIICGPSPSAWYETSESLPISQACLAIQIGLVLWPSMAVSPGVETFALYTLSLLWSTFPCLCYNITCSNIQSWETIQPCKIWWNTWEQSISCV